MIPYRYPIKRMRKQHFGIDRRPTRVAVARFQGLAHKSEVDVTVHKPQQMIFGNMIFDPEVVEQRLRTRLLAHHNEQRASVECDRERHQTIRDAPGPPEVTNTLVEKIVSYYSGPRTSGPNELSITAFHSPDGCLRNTVVAINRRV